MIRARPVLPALVLAALIVSCSVPEPDAEPPAVRSPRPDDPPANLVEKYGPPPAGGPTGRKRTVEGIEFIELSPGYFLMGSDVPEDENPRRWVEIPEAFAIARTEVTQEQYRRFGRGHSYYEHCIFWRGRRDPPDGPRYPAGTPYPFAVKFCDWLSRRGPIDCSLPTERQWEYACRAGSSADFCFGSDWRKLGEYAWFSPDIELVPTGSTSDYDPPPVPHEVGLKLPNAWGLHDMHGNVREWCSGRWSEGEGDVEDPAPEGFTYRVVRGGARCDDLAACRSGSRSRAEVEHPSMDIGFRPVAIFRKEE